VSGERTVPGAAERRREPRVDRGARHGTATRTSGPAGGVPLPGRCAQRLGIDGGGASPAGPAAPSWRTGAGSSTTACRASRRRRRGRRSSRA